MTNTLKTIAFAALTLVAGYGLGYFYAPDKIKVEEKIVERTKIVKEESKKNTYKYDPQTGKLIEHVEETGQKVTSTDSSSVQKVSEKEKTRKMWALKIGGAKTLNKSDDPTARVGAEVRLPFFDSWFGTEADLSIDQPKLGAYFRLEF